MRQRVADYIADFLVRNHIVQVFSVTGGGAMHLNDAFGHHPKLNCLYNHHEQASAMAAEAYARVNNRIAAVCVTSGPGATNAITGVVGGWMDSIPMLVLSGQVRYATSVYASGLKLRSRGIQEFDIIGSVSNMTKYARLISDPLQIRRCLEEAVFHAYEGRPGPCWLDIPLDVQGAVVETDELPGFVPPERNRRVSPEEISAIWKELKKAKRPVLYIGNGVRLAGAHQKMLELVRKLNIPVVTGMGSVDAIASDHPLYIGRIGTTGDRAANFALQNADLFLSFGGRLGYLQTGFSDELWAPGAYKIINDIDEEELKKDSIHADMKICCDAAELIGRLEEEVDPPLFQEEGWLKQCTSWKENYPVVLPKHYRDKNPNIYAFFREMTKKLEGTDALVVSVGTSRVAGSQASCIKEGVRFITNPSTAAMGYDLPAAIGVCMARSRKKTVLVTGDGSLQMNIQELQTILQNHLPVIVFVMNNQGYQSIRTTQSNFFQPPLIGVGPDSGDLSFPDLSKLSQAYGIPYHRCESMETMDSAIDWALSRENACICEMILSIDQRIEPRVASARKEDGSMVSGTLENMYPFLPEDEVERNMSISRRIEANEA